MKSLVLLVAVTVLTPSTFAASLECQTLPSTDTYNNPTLSMTAKISKSYLTGSQLKGIKSIYAKVTAAERHEQIGDLTIDPAYSPHGNPNRVRLNTDSIEAFDDAENAEFDGIIHGFIFPKQLGDDDITSREADGTISFKASLISSTDSYHDGIYSYFPMNCTLK